MEWEQGRLLVNGTLVGEGPIDQTLRFSFGTVALTVGMNGGTSVNRSYDAPFGFTGDLQKVVFEIGDDRNITAPGDYHDD